MAADKRTPQQPSPFGTLLRAWREHASLSQERLAERAGLGVRTIRYLEAGQARPQETTVRLLADALGLDGPARAQLAAAANPPRGDPPTAPAAAGRSSVAVPAQLPAGVAGFTGRAEQLALLDAVLAEQGDDSLKGGGQGRAVVISAIGGTAGVGKTALAVHWAHQAASQFPDGQLYVNLHGWSPGPPLSPMQALAHLLGGLGVDADRIPMEVDQAAGLYRTRLAGKRVLLVLDNARDAAQVRPLLPGNPGCVVVTSRDRLVGLVASHGARRLTLDVLAPDEAVALLAGILGEERVEAEPEVAATLAEVCGLLPLALRIAAANLACHPNWSIAGYLARLRAGDRLAELAVDGDPEATVRAAFDCSYASLDVDARRLFRLLGLIPGPDFTQQAAAAISGMPVPQAERRLESLATAHLVEPRGPGRFGFHDLLRLYARQRTDNDDAGPERQQALERLLQWYLHSADAANRLLYPGKLQLPVPTTVPGPPAVEFPDHAEAVAWLDAERASLTAAVLHAAAHGQRPAAWLLADTLRTYFWENRYTVDWLTVAEAALRAAEAEGDPQAQASTHRSLGAAHQCLGGYGKAAEHYGSAVLLARQAGWMDGEAAALSALGTVCTELGQLQQAADYHAQALVLYRRTGRGGGQAVALINLSHVYLEMGWPGKAADHLTEALARYREVGAPGGQAVALVNLGEAYRDLGRLDAADARLTQALALARDRGSRYGEAASLHVLATVRRDAGRCTDALELAESALVLAREIGDRRIEAEALNTLGSVQRCLGCAEQAAERHRGALELARRISARAPEIEALLGVAASCEHQGWHSQALEHAEQACTLACEGSFRVLEGRAHAALAAIHLDLDHDGEAAGHARQALEILQETGHRLGQARALVVLGRALRETGDAGAGRSCWREALALFTDIGTPEAEQVSVLLDGWASSA